MFLKVKKLQLLTILSILLLTPNNSYAQTAWCDDASAEFCYLVDEGSGTTLTDSSSNGRTANFKGSGEPAWAAIAGTNAPSYASQMISYDGTDDFVDVADDDVFTWVASTDASMVMWFIADTLNTSNNQRNWLYTKGAGSNYEWAIYLNGNGTNTDPKFEAWTLAGASRVNFTGTTSVNTGQWYHIAVTHDVDSDPDTYEIYLDAADIGGTTSNPVGTGNGTSEVDFMRRGDSAANFIDGKQTESAFFSSTLTLTDINDIMTNGLQQAAAATASGIVMQGVVANGVVIN